LIKVWKRNGKNTEVPKIGALQMSIQNKMAVFSKMALMFLLNFSNFWRPFS
jgi:hypothetical protein